LGEIVRVMFGVLGIICILVGITAVLFASYYIAVMQRGVRPERRSLFLPFLGPLQLLIPQLWTEDGNRARIRFLICILVFVICLAIIELIKSLPVSSP